MFIRSVPLNDVTMRFEYFKDLHSKFLGVKSEVRSWKASFFARSKLLWLYLKSDSHSIKSENEPLILSFTRVKMCSLSSESQQNPTLKALRMTLESVESKIRKPTWMHSFSPYTGWAFALSQASGVHSTDWVSLSVATFHDSAIFKRASLFNYWGKVSEQPYRSGSRHESDIKRIQYDRLSLIVLKFTRLNLKKSWNLTICVHDSRAASENEPVRHRLQWSLNLRNELLCKIMNKRKGPLW